MNSNVNETPEKSTQRTVFFVSDATAITAETLANAVLAQFHGLKYLRYRMPFVNTEEKAKAAAVDTILLKFINSPLLEFNIFMKNVAYSLFKLYILCS